MKTRTRIAIAALVSLPLLGIIGYLLSRQPTKTFVSDKDGYSATLPSDWQSKPRQGGTQFIDQSGTTRLEVLVFDDQEMNDRYLFSKDTAQKLHESYHDSYQVDEDSITVSTTEINNIKALTVRYPTNAKHLELLNSLSGSGLSADELVDAYILHEGLTYVVRTSSEDTYLASKIEFGS